MPDEVENTNSQNGEQQDNQVQEDEQPQESSADESGESGENQDNSLTERERQFLARAKKAESKLKEFKGEDKKSNEQTADYLSRDEAMLIAKGIDEERLNLLKRLQTADYYQSGEKKPLTEYQEDPAYKAVDEKLQEEDKRQKAQATSNRGGGSPVEEVKPGMSEEEHRKVWEKYQK